MNALNEVNIDCKHYQCYTYFTGQKKTRRQKQWIRKKSWNGKKQPRKT